MAGEENMRMYHACAPIPMTTVAHSNHRLQALLVSSTALCLALSFGTYEQADATTSFSQQQQLIDLLNRERANAKLPPFRLDQKLTNAAQAFADDMNKRQYFTHTTPEGATLKDRLTTSGYLTQPCTSCRWKAVYAENLAYGTQPINQMLKNKDDRSNVLNPNIKDIGVGVSGRFWVEDFGAITVINPPPLSPAALAAQKKRILDLVNQERAKINLPPLKTETHLTQAAQNQAMDLTKRKYFDHISPEGTTPTDRIKASGYMSSAPCAQCNYSIYYGENIAKNQETADEVMKAWMQSPGHRANILNPKFQQIGIGIDGPSWVQEFGGVTISPLP